jgi:peptidyl-prolyl cis-trans isomerase A (cyclophilin A)
VGANRPKVKFVTSEGDFVVEVYPDKAPKTVENFLQYVKDKHYDGTIFHRVISNFMVQGGGYDATYAEKKTRPPVRMKAVRRSPRAAPKTSSAPWPWRAPTTPIPLRRSSSST